LVHFEKRGAVARLTLDRPAKLNALAGTMREQLLEGLERCAADSEVRCVVITGAGSAFCAGGDLETMWSLKEREDAAGFGRLVELGMQVVRTLRELDKPSIAAIPGVAAGAGLSLAAACDLRIAAAGARFAASFVKIGLHPDWGLTYFLPRLVGAGKAAELCLTGEPIGAEEALRIGLVERVVLAESLEAAALDLARALAAREPLALSLIRTSLAAALPGDLEAALERERSAQIALFQSADFRERLAAFRQRRWATP
jgi:2-(1,2-epoxy-1,2-dihydrophenyl)acetyl-CoA isomerase